jgi:hypothetical protein
MVNHGQVAKDLSIRGLASVHTPGEGLALRLAQKSATSHEVTGVGNDVKRRP